jgi:hypothetical protein
MLAERLKHRCPSAHGNVFAAADLAGVAEAAQVAPALHVMLYDYAPIEAVGGETRWRETWLVVAVVRHSARNDRAQAQQQQAAPVVREALAALSGWFPGHPVVGHLEFVPGPRPAFSDSHAWFPFAVVIEVVTSGVVHPASGIER